MMSNGHSSNWSLDAFSEYLSRSNQSQKSIEYLEVNAAELGLTTASTFLSIGPGNGEVDVYLLKTCLSNVRSYTGVDVDEESLEAFATKVKTSGLETRLKVQLLKEDVTKWPGPDEAVDVILLSHLLYYLPDCESRVALLTRCVTWLKQGGRIIIFVGQRDGGDEVFRCLGKRFDLAHFLYGANGTRAELTAAGLTNIYKEDVFSFTHDLRVRDKKLIDLLLQKNTTDAEYKEADAYLKEILPIDRLTIEMVVAITVRKEDFC